MNDVRAREQAEAAVLSSIDDLSGLAVEKVSELIRIPSVTPSYPGQAYEELVGGEGEANKALSELYEDAGCSVHWVEHAAGRPNLIGVIEGPDPEARSLILNGHVDVVPPGPPERWAGGNPFSGAVRDGRIYGRGASDQKSALVASAVAALALKEAGVRLRGSLILQSCVGEEVGDHDLGVNAVLEAGFRADGAIVTEPTAPVAHDPFHPPDTLLVAPMSAGLLWMTLEVEGKAGHNNLRPELVRAGGVGEAAGVNAIEKAVYLLEMLQELEQRWGQSHLHPLFKPGHFSLHPGVIVGGPDGALVPFFISRTCRVEYSILYPPDVPVDEIKNEIETFVEAACRLDPWLEDHPPRITWNLNWEPSVLDVEHELTATVARARREVLGLQAWTSEGLDPAIRGFDAVCDATYLNRAGVPTVICGPGSIQFAHAIDESVSIREVLVAAKTYALASIEWCGLGG